MSHRELGSIGNHFISARRSDQNVGGIERAVCSALGLALIGFGISRRGGAGVAAAAGGALLAWHGLKKHSFVYEKLGISQADADDHSHPLTREAQMRATITIARPADELFARWRDVETLAEFFPHITQVTAEEDGRSVWRATLPRGLTIEWLAVFSESADDQSIRWSTPPAAFLEHEGVVSFKPAGGRGTIVTLEQRYRLPGGALGVIAAKLMHADPHQEAKAALRRFKQRMETGEITRADPPSGREPPPQRALPAASSPHPGQAADREHELKPMRTPRGEYQPPDEPIPEAPADPALDEASKESFPASDPPAIGGSTSDSDGADRRPRSRKGS